MPDFWRKGPNVQRKVGFADFTIFFIIYTLENEIILSQNEV